MGFRIRRVLFVVAACTVLLCGCSDKAVTQVTRGNLSETIEWSFEKGTLSIHGNGEIPDFDMYTNGLKAPWAVFENEISCISVEDGITAIGDFAFAYTSARTVELPESLYEIGDYAFFCCDKLTDIEIPQSISGIGESAFANCLNISEFFIPSNVVEIGDKAFYNCTSALQIEVDGGNEVYTSVEGVLFNEDITVLIAYPAGKTNTDYQVPDSVTKLENGAFAYNANLKAVKAGTGVTGFGNGCFANCILLENAELPLGTTKISEKMFWGCTSLTSFNVPAGTSEIEKSAFSNCTALKSITLPQSITKIESMAFSGCKTLENVDIPDRVNIIEYRTFSGCSSLNTVDLPLLLEKIDSYAFSYCENISKIIAGDNLEKVEAFAFRGCGKLRDIEYEGTRTMWKSVIVEGGNDYFADAVVSFPNDTDNNG